VDFAAHARSFGTAAALYHRSRPRYPLAALHFALGGAAPLRVVDLGAGTGILTGQLIELGHEVTAIEPDERMRSHIPGDARAGSAEHIPLPNASVDAVLAGQSYHWFDPEPAHAQIARVLRARGHFCPLWNVRDHAEAWVGVLSEILHDTGHSAEHEAATGGFGEQFGPVSTATFRWSQPHTVDSLLDLIRTRSYYLTADPSAQHRLTANIHDLVATHPDLVGRDTFELPYVTHAYRAERLDQART
jgi:SAM-dependent methyltransferase